MKVKAGSWSMLSPEEKFLLLTVISNKTKSNVNMNNESGVDSTGMSINKQLALIKKDCYEET